MQSPLLSTTYAYDSQQVIYIFDQMRVKVNTQRSRVKKCITSMYMMSQYYTFTILGPVVQN